MVAFTFCQAARRYPLTSPAFPEWRSKSYFCTSSYHCFAAISPANKIGNLYLCVIIPGGVVAIPPTSLTNDSLLPVAIQPSVNMAIIWVVSFESDRYRGSTFGRDLCYSLCC